MAREIVTIRNVDKELWFKFVAHVKTQKKSIAEVLEKLIKEELDRKR